MPVNVAVGGKGVDVGVSAPSVGVAETGTDVLVGWFVGGIDVTVADGLTVTTVFVGVIVGGIEVAVG